MADIDTQEQEEEQAMTLRQRMVQAKKEKEKEASKNKATEPMRRGTGMLLKWAWINLLPSLGLTIIYINMHVFLRLVFPKAFCKLGEEWMPKKVASHSSKNIAGTAFGIVEVMGLILLDIIAFFIIMSVVAVIVWLVDNVIVTILDGGVKAYNWVFE